MDRPLLNKLHSYTISNDSLRWWWGNNINIGAYQRTLRAICDRLFLADNIGKPTYRLGPDYYISLFYTIWLC